MRKTKANSQITPPGADAKYRTKAGINTKKAESQKNACIWRKDEDNAEIINKKLFKDRHLKRHKWRYADNSIERHYPARNKVQDRREPQVPLTC